MNSDCDNVLLAIDVGNSRVKFGLFPDVRQDWRSGRLLQPLETWAVSSGEPIPWERLVARADAAAANTRRAAIAGVNPAGVERLLADWPHSLWPAPAVIRGPESLGLTIRVDFPDKVGIDRLLNAVAANVIRPADRPAIVIDTGTATTVDLVSADGAFEGGAILPGFELSARALHQYTALLPFVPPVELAAAPPPLGRNTRDAIAAGVYWGQIGAVRELLSRISTSVLQDAAIVLTGGAAPLLAPHLARPDARLEPDLPLKGLAVVACRV